jgi:chemotaxis protein methyltransferase CheR
MLGDNDFRLLLEHLDRPWAGFRKVRKGVKKRVRRHMEALGCAAVEAYLQQIDADAGIRADCERCLMVTISRFYRDRRLWDHLQARLLPAMADLFTDGLNAWSAGCARGEEPYSLSMVWEEIAANLSGAPELHLLATDANPQCLTHARQGVYPRSSLKEAPEHAVTRWFEKWRGRTVRVDPSLRHRIDWQEHHLLDPPPGKTFHLILLRNNLLTYYQGERLQTALAAIIERLPPGGALILGSHERLPGGFDRLTRDPECLWVYRLEV